MAHNALMELEQAAMIDLMPPLADRIVLDLASGTGRYGLIAQQRGARQVIALDNSAAMLASNPLSMRVSASMSRLPLNSKSIDVVICGLALGHLPYLRSAFGEIARVLKPGGVALISDFHPFAYLGGARRTFTASDGRVYAVEHYPHLYSDYHAAASDFGLRLDALREPIYAASSAPVVIVFRFVYERERQISK